MRSLSVSIDKMRELIMTFDCFFEKSGKSKCNCLGFMTNRASRELFS